MSASSAGVAERSLLSAQVLRAAGVQVPVVNGVERTVHIVVKKAPFRVLVPLHGGGHRTTSLPQRSTASKESSSASANIDSVIADRNLKVLLIYAPLEELTDEMLHTLSVAKEREVHAPRQEPLEYTVEEVDTQQCCLTLEVKLNILSTQHEGTCFGLLVTYSAEDSTETVGAITEPLSVVSRPERVKQPVLKQRRQSERARPATREEKDERLRAGMEQAERSVGETNMFLRELQLRHTQTLHLLRQASPLYMQTDGVGPLQADLPGRNGSAVYLLETAAAGDGQSSLGGELDHKKRKAMEAAEMRSPLEDAFEDFVASFGNVAPGSRPTQVRKSLRSVDAMQQEKLRQQQQETGANDTLPESASGVAQFLETYCLVAAELQQERHDAQMQLSAEGSTRPHNVECNCDNCPWKSELQRLDEFYSEALGLSFDNL